MTQLIKSPAFNMPALLHDAYVISQQNIRDIAPDVVADGRMRVMPASYYADTTVQERALFGTRNAFYGFLTQELIDWLQDRIAGRTAIEIGAGHGGLAATLGIPATDSKMQENPQVAAQYEAIGQPTIQYGDNVERLDAKDAVTRYKPQVIIASWVTHQYKRSRHEAGGNMFGVDEEYLLKRCEEYIFIGNEQVHKGKSIWTLPHDKIQPDWLYSRAVNGTPDFIATWKKG